MDLKQKIMMLFFFQKKNYCPTIAHGTDPTGLTPIPFFLTIHIFFGAVQQWMVYHY